MEIKLRECPFCGKKDTVDFTDAKELEECTKFESEDCPCYEEMPSCYCVAVVCSVYKKGCGAISGYAVTREKAIELWNRRAK